MHPCVLQGPRKEATLSLDGWGTLREHYFMKPPLLKVVRGEQIGPQGQLSNSEASAHMALWAILKSPLILGADLTCAQLWPAG